ncbi:MAG: DUF861 domain-containing protein [Clostridia bacterium]|nr:DUF861 domain-containing protein [Clostridia bacterium]
MDRELLKQLIREVLEEETKCPVKLVRLPQISVSEKDRLDTGDANHRVYTRDVVSLEESPSLGCGIMEMERTTFPWTLDYDEIDYVISGQLTVEFDGHRMTAGPGEMLLIPKGCSICFSVEDHARFLYVTYPANWQAQCKGTP